MTQLRGEALAKAFVALCSQHRVKEPVRELRFAKNRRWRFDYAWPNQPDGGYGGGWALEVEGGAFTQGRHTRGAGFLADMEKYNEAALLGWRVLRVTPQQLCTIDTIVMLHRTLHVYTGPFGSTTS